jgi:AraC family transcriptional regulator
MSSRVELLSFSEQPLKVVHESQYVVMVLQPGACDFLGVGGAPTEQVKYVRGESALCCRQVAALIQSHDQVRALRFEVSDFHLSEAAGKANKEIELRNIHQLRDPRIAALMTAVDLERASGFPSGQLFLQSVELALAAVLVQRYTFSTKATRPIKGGLSDLDRRNVINFVRSRISENLSLTEMAAVTGLSLAHFSHAFKKSIGKSPHQFVLQQRVQCAKDLIGSLNLRMIDIALACGFKTQQHFARIFREISGLSPTEYQQLKTGKRLRDSYVSSSANPASLRSTMTVED